MNPAILDQSSFLLAMQTTSFQTFLLGGIGLVIFARTHSSFPAAGNRRAILVMAAVLEVFGFARSTTTSFPMADLYFPSVQEFYKQNPGDYRTLNLFNPDASMVLGSGNLWGY